MVVSKKLTILLLAVAILAAGLFTMIDRTYAFTNTVTAEGDEASISLFTTDNTGASFKIEDGSRSTLFSENILWEPGAMYKATLTVTNTGSVPLQYWFYPRAKAVAANETNLADVLDVYVYDGIYNGGRPTLPANTLSQENTHEQLYPNTWTYLGPLSKLPPETKPSAFGILYNTSNSHSYTILLKMRESADNKYMGKTAEVCVSLKATQLVSTS